MAKTENRPSWFKMFRNQKALIDSVPDAEVGQALKAVFQYFEDRTVIEMSPLVFAVFSSLKPYIDESYADFEAASKKNRENVKQRWAKHNDTTDTTGIQSLPVGTTDSEAEADTPNGVDASVSGSIETGEPPLCGGGPPTRFYVDSITGKVVDRGEAWR